MRSPLELVQEALERLEASFIPYRSLWWRFWTPPMGKEDRYQEGYFDGWGEPEEHMRWLDIRRAINNRPLRLIYKSLPYIDVRPTVPPSDADDKVSRAVFASSTTEALYHHGKALYPRETIQDLENQLKAYEKGRKPVPKILERCEAPQTAFVHYRDFDGVIQHQGTWKPGAVLHGSGSVTVFGRPQVEFRTIQELVIPDPDSYEVYAPDQWEASIAFNSLYVSTRLSKESMLEIYDVEDDQLQTAEILQNLDLHRSTLDSSQEWKAVRTAVSSSRTLRSIDKIVFLSSVGYSDDCDYCKRALFLLGVATRLRDLVLASRDGTEGKTCGAIPIYMPSFGTDRIWNRMENPVLLQSGVIPVDSHGGLLLKIDDRTAVISFRHWNPVKQIVADIARPAIMICKPMVEGIGDFMVRVEEREGDRVRLPLIRARGIDNSIICRDPDSPRVREMLRNYDALKLPQLPGDTAPVEMMTCYLRKPQTPLKPDYYT
ncbi:hypothetical protein GQ53DRAFT_271391 [Thozetella sp. PMI_491]|nr:hypothetical protein GQ53DRAFT_271391 [Thozetella sp. PMI_491]